jgi:hypothetical protein
MENAFSVKEMERLDAGLAPWESMSFACGGWLQYYLFGVGKALQESGMDKGVTYAGCSAGALTAVGLALGGNFDEGFEGAKACIPKAYGSLRGLFQLHLYVEENVVKTLAPHFSKEKASQIQIAVTSLPLLGAKRLTNFTSVADLKDAILASCAAFPAAKAQTYQGKLYVDGGLSDFQPIIDSDTITVSPFYFSNCDIKPSRYVPLWWAFMPPNSNHTVDWLYSLGYEDCLQYLEQRKILDYLRKKQLSKLSAEVPEQEVESSMDKAWSQLMAFTRRRMGLAPAHASDHRKVSLRRFLGYDLRTFSNHYVSFVLDLCLLFLLLFVWKPLALCLIYAELLFRIVYLNVMLLFQFTGVFTALERILRRQAQAVTKIVQNPAADFVSTTLEEMRDCIWCILSLSLAMRFISGGPRPTVELRKHDRLTKHSLLYRVFRHII